MSETTTFAAPYDFATLKAAVLKVDPEQKKPVNRGEVIQAWAAAGASDKTQRNKALKQYSDDALLLGNNLKVQLGETPLMMNAFGSADAKSDYFEWQEGNELFVHHLVNGAEKGKWHRHPRGFHFKFLTKGSGSKSPNEENPVVCHYEGKLVTGQIFDSSFARKETATFAPAQVIESWKVILQLLRGGDVVEIAAPPALAYGPRGTPGIPPQSTLLFKIAVIEVPEGKDATLAVKMLEAITKKKYEEL